MKERLKKNACVRRRRRPSGPSKHVRNTCVLLARANIVQGSGTCSSGAAYGSLACDLLDTRRYRDNYNTYIRRIYVYSIILTLLGRDSKNVEKKSKLYLTYKIHRSGKFRPAKDSSFWNFYRFHCYLRRRVNIFEYELLLKINRKANWTMLALIFVLSWKLRITFLQIWINIAPQKFSPENITLWQISFSYFYFFGFFR